MVIIAARPPPEACPVGSVSVSSTYYKIIPLKGAQLNRFITNDFVEKRTCDVNTDYVLSLTAPANTIYPASPDIGPHFRLAPDIESVFSGNQIKILIEARSTGSSDERAFELNYFSGPKGASGWQRYELLPTYSQFVFDYTVPKASQEQGVDYLAIRPVAGASAEQVEIRDITFLTLSLMNGTERRKALADHVDP